MTATQDHESIPGPLTLQAGEFRPARVVVPLDGSTDSETALPVAEYLVDSLGARLCVVHALDEQIPETEAARLFQDYVAELGSRHGFKAAPGDVVVEAGAASDVILRNLRDDDLLVIASHGRGGLRATLFGSVADKVVRATSGPALVVPICAEPAAPLVPIDHVLIAVDESDSAASAAAIGRSLAQKLGARISLVHAYLPQVMSAGPDAYAVATPATGEVSQEAAEQVVASAATPGEEQLVVLGSTVDGIAEAAEQAGAGLVVAGSKGKGWFGRLLTGSVGEGLMHALDRPVLIVPVAAVALPIEDKDDQARATTDPSASPAPEAVASLA